MSEKKVAETLEIWSKDLTKVYGKKNTALTAVDKIALRVEPGIHGFLGPNGAGKTTTINMLVGALSITAGEAKVRGHKAGSIGAKQLIGFLPQDPQFYNDMTGEEYLIYLGMLGGLSRRDANQKAQELLHYFDIWDARNRVIGKYSGGMKQKIGLAASLIHDPKILILDEPTANLDPIGRQSIIDRIRELSGKISVFVSSHILAEIEQMCDRVTMIDEGKIVVSDTIKRIKQEFIGNTYVLNTNKNEEIFQQLQDDPNIVKLWLAEEDGEKVIHIIPKEAEMLQKKIPRLVIDNEAILYSFKRPEVSLQDIFMEVMVRKEEGEE
ncbi:MAG: ABC transporter ATP-binding protein [Promethearchaeota archaeon]